MFVATDWVFFQAKTWVFFKTKSTPLAAMGGVGHQAADAAAEQLGLSRRQVYVLVKYLSPALHQCTRERRILAVGTRCTRIYG